MPDSPVTADACELCRRSGLELTRHHLIPRTRHSKPRTRRQHDKAELTERIAMLCRPCHAHVHATLTEQELAEHYNTVEALGSHLEVARFVKWVARRPVDTKVPIKRSKSRKGAYK